MPKTDYLNDPNAPRANSIVVAVTAFVRNESGYVLLIERTDNKYWALPGGAQDLGESVTEAVAREVKEETGVTVAVNRLSGIYSNPNHVIAYDNGEVRQEFSLCFHAQPISGELRTSSESKQVHWISPDRIDSLQVHPTMRLRIQHGLENRQSPYIG